MDVSRWERIKDVVGAAMALPPEHRRGYAVAACADAPDLLEEALTLLNSDDGQSFLEQTVTEEPLGGAWLRAGARLGAYRLVRELGRGGMGLVWLAERTDGAYRKQVAIKLLKRGMDAEGIVRRFRRERQILADLDHPNIARLLDGGVAEDGAPFLAMDYVEGEPIDRYCRQKALTLKQRLSLFRRVCAAVHAAHQNLVVHCDLKPSNILVDGRGQPRLLDFGVARLAEPQGAATADIGSRWLTPRYASPEQLEGRRVTTASDVFALGVLLFELLTDRSPYGADCGDEAAVREAALATRHEPPSRGVADTGLRRRLRGDLDNIVLMAIRREPDRRYRSVEQLAEDIQRFLNGYPIMARKETVLYRAGKFARRNKLGLAFAAALFLLPISFGVARALEQRRTAREAETAQRVADFMVELFEVADPDRARGETIPAKAILDRGAGRIRDELADQPLVQARLMGVMGRVYLNLGLLDEAEPLLVGAEAVARRLHGPASAETAQALHDLADLRWNQGEYEASEPLYRQALKLRRGLWGEEHPATAESVGDLAILLTDMGEYDAAVPLHREAIRLRRAMHAEPNPDLAATLNNFGHCQRLLGAFQEAEALFREAVAIHRQGDPGPNMDLAAAINNLGLTLSDQARYEEAEPLLREALAMHRQLLGEDHALTATNLNNLAAVLDNRGDFASAEPLYRQALAAHRGALGPEHPDLAMYLINLGALYHQRGAFASAEPLYREALALNRANFPDGHLMTATNLNNLGLLVQSRGDVSEGGRLLADALAMRLELLGPDHPEIPQSRHNLALNRHRRGDLAAAEALFREALRGYAATLGEDSPAFANCQAALANLLIDMDRPDEAEPLARAAHGALVQLLPAGHYRAAIAANALGAALLAQGRIAEAEPLLEESCDLLATTVGRDAPVARQALSRLDFLASVRAGQRNPRKM